MALAKGELHERVLSSPLPDQPVHAASAGQNGRINTAAGPSQRLSTSPAEDGSIEKSPWPFSPQQYATGSDTWHPSCEGQGLLKLEDGPRT